MRINGPLLQRRNTSSTQMLSWQSGQRASVRKGSILLIQLGYGGHSYADQSDMNANTVDPIEVIKSIPIQILASLCFPASQVCKSSQCEENGSPAQQHLCCISSLHGLTGQ